MTNRKTIIVSVAAAFLLFPVWVMAAPALLHTVEVSYISNSLTDYAEEGSFGEMESTINSSGITSSAYELGLDPGIYTLKNVAGSNTGNPVDTFKFNDDDRNLDDYWDHLIDIGIKSANDKALLPDSGYNGGNTGPGQYDENENLTGYSDEWWHGINYWIGTSLPSQTGSESNIGNVGDEHLITINNSEKIWFFWLDTWNHDNVGGTTLEIWTSDSSTVPIPSTLFLFGFGLLALSTAGRRGAGARV